MIYGGAIAGEAFFDSVLVNAGARTDALLAAAEAAGYNLRRVNDTTLAVAFHEVATGADVAALVEQLTGKPADIAALDAAARAGLRDGDIILQIGNSAVLNVKEFEVAIGKHDKSKPLNVLFRRGDWTQYAVIRPNR